MKRSFFVVGVVAVLAGCAGPHGAMKPLPKIASEDNTAEIYIVRNSNVFGSAVNYTVTLDSREILGIGIGEYTSFKVNPGKHAVGVKCNGGWAPGEHFNEKKAQVERGSIHYFMPRAGGVCAVIEVINEEKAKKYIEKAKFVKIQ